MHKTDLNQIAKTCHIVHTTFSQAIGHGTQPSFDEVSEAHKNTIISSIEKILSGEITSPMQSHDNFVKEKLEAGWKHSDEYSIENKTNPRLVPFSELPNSNRIKEELFFNTVKSFI